MLPSMLVLIAVVLIQMLKGQGGQTLMIMILASEYWCC